MSADFIFTDKHGKQWVDAEYLRKHFGITDAAKKFFYDYDFWRAKAEHYLTLARKARQEQTRR